MDCWLPMFGTEFESSLRVCPRPLEAIRRRLDSRRWRHELHSKPGTRPADSGLGRWCGSCGGDVLRLLDF